MRRLFRPGRGASSVRRAIDGELSFHLEMRTLEFMEAGLDPDAARRAALQSFGDIDSIAADCRQLMTERLGQERRRELMLDFWQDVRFSARALRQHPVFTLAAVSTLAIAIGAVTAIFSAVDLVLLRPLPYGDAERIVALGQTQRETRSQVHAVSPANFLDWRAGSTSFSEMAASDPRSFTLTGAGEPENVRTWLVTDGFFRVLGVNAARGRTFVSQDYATTQPNVMVVSDGLWRERFGGDPSALGRTLVLNGQPHTIVGIMPPHFRFPVGRDIWIPKVFGESERLRRGGLHLGVIARLAPPATLERARADMDAIARRLAAEYPRANDDVGIAVRPLRESLAGNARTALLVLFGAVAFVVLIACVNVASLLLAKGTTREREFAIRGALGAGRGRLVRQLVTESVLLALLGGGAGVALAHWGIGVIAALGPAELPQVADLRIDSRVLGFTLAVSLASALLFGLAPALRLSKVDLLTGLGAGARGTGSADTRRLRDALVVAEVALAMVLLVGAGLLVRSFSRLSGVDPGFRAENLLTLQLFAWGPFPQSPQRATYVEETVDRIATLPNVTGVGVTLSLPFAEHFAAANSPFGIVGRPTPAPGQEPTASINVATPGYFDAMRIPIRRGRNFTRADHAKAPPVAVINESLARRYWPGEDPIGKHLALGPDTARVVTEIVGVAADVRFSSLDDASGPEMYLPHAQSPTGTLSVVVRTRGDPLAVLPPVKEAIRTGNKNQAFYSVATMEQRIGETLRTRRFIATLLGAFAFVALALAVVGIYGSISYATGQRTREIGVRMALGAQPRDILQLIATRGLALTATGVALGIAGAAALSRLLRALLYDISASDPITYLALGALVLSLAALASWVPARRALRVTLAETLRAA